MKILYVIVGINARAGTKLLMKRNYKQGQSISNSTLNS